MTLNLDLKPEIEQGLRAQAHARGVSLDEFLADVITQATSARRAAQCDAANVPDSPDRAVKPFWEMILDSMKDTPQDVLDRLARDAAAEHDHYIYGTPKEYS